MFKKLGLVCVFVTSILFNVSCASTLTLRKSDRVILSNGIELILIRDTSLPYYTINTLVKVGSANDPSSREGLANMVGELLDKGTRQKNAQQIAATIGQIGGELSVSVNDDYTMVSASSLSSHQKTLTKEYFDILFNPAFKKKEILRAKKQVASQIIKVADDPSSFSSKMLYSALYSKHPYGRETVGFLKSVKKIQQKDIKQFYREHYVANNLIVSVVGNFEDATVAKVKDILSNHRSGPLQKTTHPPVNDSSELDIQLVHKKELKQSQVKMGHIGIKRSNEDYLKLRVASLILGGSFTSRLMKRIRVEKGLTYGIYSSFYSQLDRGPFVISTFTRHEKVGEMLSETLAVLDEFCGPRGDSGRSGLGQGLSQGNFSADYRDARKAGSQHDGFGILQCFSLLP